MAEIRDRRARRHAVVGGWLAAWPLALLGCASAPSGTGAQSPGPARVDVSSSERPEQMRLAMVESLMAERRYFAALAHLDALGSELGSTPYSLWLRAECLRRTEQPAAAAALLESLLDTEQAGDAYRGLGLIAARAGRLDVALDHLLRARELRPTDGRIRNDLGYVLLLAGRVEASRIELSTALELETPAAVANLLLLLYATEDEGEAGRLIEEHGVEESSTRTIRAEARDIVSRWSRAESAQRENAEGEARAQLPRRRP